MKKKAKNKDQPTNNHKKRTEKKKTKEKNRKIKNKSNGKHKIYHGPLFQKWIDGRF